MLDCELGLRVRKVSLAEWSAFHLQGWKVASGDGKERVVGVQQTPINEEGSFESEMEVEEAEKVSFIYFFVVLSKFRKVKLCLFQPENKVVQSNSFCLRGSVIQTQ